MNFVFISSTSLWSYFNLFPNYCRHRKLIYEVSINLLKEPGEVLLYQLYMDFWILHPCIYIFYRFFAKDDVQASTIGIKWDSGLLKTMLSTDTIQLATFVVWLWTKCITSVQSCVLGYPIRIEQVHAIVRQNLLSGSMLARSKLQRFVLLLLFQRWLIVVRNFAWI